MKPFVAVLAILALVFALAFGFRSSGNSHPTQAELETDLVCVTCHAPLDESSSPLAAQMKSVIREKIAAGWSKDRIENMFVAELGPQVLAVPKSSGFDLLAWLLPLAAIVFGAGAVGFGARAWLTNRDDGESAASQSQLPSLPASLELRVDQELERFDS